jgi:hypothetical protein
MAGLGFKIADGYVEVHARYDKGELRRAAQDAADDSDGAFNKERERNSKSGDTRDTNRRIGKQASVDFVRGVQEQVNRQKQTPFISLDNVKRDASKLGRVHVAEFHRAVEEGYTKEEGRVLTIGRKFAQHLNAGFKREVDQSYGKYRRIGQRITDAMFGKDNAAKAGVNFFKAFVEAVTFGQADFAKPEIVGKLTKWGARIGSILGVSLAGALVVQIGNAITGALPLVLGAAILALPIADLIARNVDLEKGKLSFKKNGVGAALKGFIRQAQQLADAMGKVFKGPFIAGLKQATSLFKQIEGPMKRAVQAITPGAMAMWKGFLGGIISFGKAFQPALAGINAGLKQWGIEFPKIGKALGQMFSTILKNPELVRNAVKGLSSTVQFLIKALGGVVTFLTYALGAWNNLWRLADVGWRIFSKWIGLPGILGKIWAALKPLRTALLDAWEAFKKFATASNDKQALQRFKVLLDKIKKVWDALKPILAKALQEAWDKLKAYWNAHVKPWWDNTAKPWLISKLKAVAKAAFKALLDAAVAELKKLPGKVKTELGKVGGKVSDGLKNAVTKAKDKAKELVDKFVTKVKELPGKAKSAVSSLAGKVATEFSQAVTKGKAKAKELVDGFIRKLKELPGKAKSEAGKVKGAVTSALSGAGGWLVGAGKALMNGLANGIRAGLTWVKNAAITAAKAAVGAAKRALGIKSPSTVAAEQVGKPIAQGIGLGMRKHVSKEFKELPGMLPNMSGGKARAGNTYHSTSSWNPTINVHVAAGLDSVNAAARRALTKDIFLALEQYRKDYVNR